MDSPTNTLDLHLIDSPNVTYDLMFDLIENSSTTQLFDLQKETNQKIVHLEEIISDCNQKLDLEKIKEIEILFRRILPSELAKEITTRYKADLSSLIDESYKKIEENTDVLTHIEIQLEHLYDASMYYDTEELEIDWSDQSN
jgi:rRNA maturation protein Rpf1